MLIWKLRCAFMVGEKAMQQNNNNRRSKGSSHERQAKVPRIFGTVELLPPGTLALARELLLLSSKFNQGLI